MWYLSLYTERFRKGDSNGWEISTPHLGWKETAGSNVDASQKPRCSVFGSFTSTYPCRMINLEAYSIKPRRVSAVFWPLSSQHADSSPRLENTPDPLPPAPVLWRDWPRCRIRRGWLKVIRSETVCLTRSTQLSQSPVTTTPEKVFTRAQRAHWRLSWEQRLACNARPSDSSLLTVTLHGLPAIFVQSFGFDLVATA
jgi:hypothetical protein